MQESSPARSNNPLAPETRAAQALHYLDQETGAVAPPIHPTTTFARDADYALIGKHIYSRDGGPTVDLAEEVIRSLESAAGTRVFATGLAGTATIFETLRRGERIVVPRVMYYGALKWLRRMVEHKGIELAFFDQQDIGTLEAAVAAAKPQMVWIETPANPTFEVVDIAAAARIAHDAGAVLGVDGTNAPPCTTRALDLGADIVFHSATKFLNGHSDLTAGVVSVRELGPRFDEMTFIRTQAGSVLGAFEAWLLVRGMRTLFVRFQRQSENALALARHFEGHPKVERVIYPGLPSHPAHAIARRQMTGGFGGMLSILVKGGADEGRKVAASVKVFYPATSLGGVESLIEHRKTLEPPDSVVPDNLLRISVGIEHVSDLIADLEQALEAI